MPRICWPSIDYRLDPHRKATSVDLGKHSDKQSINFNCCLCIKHFPCQDQFFSFNHKTRDSQEHVVDLRPTCTHLSHLKTQTKHITVNAVVVYHALVAMTSCAYRVSWRACSSLGCRRRSWVVWRRSSPSPARRRRRRRSRPSQPVPAALGPAALQIELPALTHTSKTEK